MKNKLIILLILTPFFILNPLIPLSQAQQKQDSSKAPSEINQSPAPLVNSIPKAASHAGVRTCTNRINQVFNFLTAGTQNFNYYLFFPPKNPDQQMTSVSMEIPLKNAPAAYATASFAPDQSGGCTGMYETVVYWQKSCNEVANKNFGSFKKAGVLSKDIYVRDGGESVKIFLMPAGKGCVTIKKEIVR